MPDGSVAHAGSAAFDADLPARPRHAPGHPARRPARRSSSSSRRATARATWWVPIPSIPERRDTARLRGDRRRVDEAARQHGARVLDLDSVLCPGGVADASGRPDGAHFDGAGADVVRPRWPGRCGEPSPPRRRRTLRDPGPATRPAFVLLAAVLVVAAGCQSSGQASRSAPAKTVPIGNPSPRSALRRRAPRDLLMGDSLDGRVPTRRFPGCSPPTASTPPSTTHTSTGPGSSIR